MSDFENKTFSLRFEPDNRAAVIGGYMADVEMEKHVHLFMTILYMVFNVSQHITYEIPRNIIK